MPLVDGDADATVAATAVGLFPGVAVGVLAVLAVPLRFRLRDMTPGALELVVIAAVDGCDTGKHKFQLRVNMLSRHRRCIQLEIRPSNHGRTPPSTAICRARRPDSE